MKKETNQGNAGNLRQHQRMAREGVTGKKTPLKNIDVVKKGK